MFGYTRPPVSRLRHIFRWDLDKTYLKTDFDSVSDLVRTARLSAEERENIPGSAALIHAIRDAGHEKHPHLIYFISGSPQQLRPVIEKKFALDGFIPDGFVLKPTLRHLLRGRFGAVKSQVGYKLSQLLIGRSEAPIGTHETLFGDDAESDAFIYALYADLIAGRISKNKFEEVLRVTGCYREQVDEIEAALEAVVREDPVRRVIIHSDQHTPPLAFVPYFPLVVPIYNHLQTAIVLYLDGTLPARAIRWVVLELIAKYGFDEKRLTNLAEDILRRRRSHLPLELLDKLAEELRGLEPKPEETENVELADEVTTVLHAIAERAEYLRTRPLVDDPPPSTATKNYAELWGADQKRREDAKRARKLAAKTRAESVKERPPEPES
jgi:hypothetical protein